MSHEQILERSVRSKAQESGRQPIEAITSKSNFEEDELVEAENSVSFAPRSSKGRVENSLRGTIRSEKSSANQGQATKATRTSKSSGKDRHSKVNTAKGPRDRRVRLSVSTAIQFYDIQDRLGFDQPSKAIEWLLKKAKPAIDELSQLPPVPVGESSRNEALKEESSAQPTSEPLPSVSTSPGSYQHYHFRESPKEVPREGSGQAHSSPGIWRHDPEFGPFGSDPGAGLTDSRGKARERARERVKDRTSGPSIAPHSQHEPFQNTFLGNQSTLFDSLYSSGGGPMRSSFTQLLQSPVPTALQSIIHSSSQSLLQNQFFSTLQGFYPSQCLTPDRSMQSSFQQQRGALQQDHILHGQAPELSGASPFILSGGMFGGAQSVLAASAMNQRLFRDEALQVPFGRGFPSNSHPGGGTSSDSITARQQDHQQQHVARASNPFANRIPARIQGIDDIDEQAIQHPHSHHHSS